jgi:hypothetical protein
MCFDFLYIIYFKTSHSKKKWARYDQKCISVFFVKYSLFLSDFNDTRISTTDFREILK